MSWQPYVPAGNHTILHRTLAPRRVSPYVRTVFAADRCVISDYYSIQGYQIELRIEDGLWEGRVGQLAIRERSGTLEELYVNLDRAISEFHRVAEEKLAEVTDG